VTRPRAEAIGTATHTVLSFSPARNFYLPGTQIIENARRAREDFKAGRGFKLSLLPLTPPSLTLSLSLSHSLSLAVIEISLSRFYYPGMDAVHAAAPLRINRSVFTAAIKGSRGCISRLPSLPGSRARASL